MSPLRPTLPNVVTRCVWTEAEYCWRPVYVSTLTLVSAIAGIDDGDRIRGCVGLGHYRVEVESFGQHYHAGPCDPDTAAALELRLLELYERIAEVAARTAADPRDLAKAAADRVAGGEDFEAVLAGME